MHSFRKYSKASIIRPSWESNKSDNRTTKITGLNIVGRVGLRSDN